MIKKFSTLLLLGSILSGCAMPSTQSSTIPGSAGSGITIHQYSRATIPALGGTLVPPDIDSHILVINLMDQQFVAQQMPGVKLYSSSHIQTLNQQVSNSIVHTLNQMGYANVAVLNQFTALTPDSFPRTRLYQQTQNAFFPSTINDDFIADILTPDIQAENVLVATPFDTDSLWQADWVDYVVLVTYHDGDPGNYFATCSPEKQGTNTLSFSLTFLEVSPAWQQWTGVLFPFFDGMLSNQIQFGSNPKCGLPDTWPDPAPLVAQTVKTLFTDANS